MARSITIEDLFEVRQLRASDRPALERFQSPPHPTPNVGGDDSEWVAVAPDDRVVGYAVISATGHAAYRVQPFLADDYQNPRAELMLVRAAAMPLRKCELLELASDRQFLEQATDVTTRFAFRPGDVGREWAVLNGFLLPMYVARKRDGVELDMDPVIYYHGFRMEGGANRAMVDAWTEQGRPVWIPGLPGDLGADPLIAGVPAPIQHAHVHVTCRGHIATDPQSGPAFPDVWAHSASAVPALLAAVLVKVRRGSVLGWPRPPIWGHIADTPPDSLFCHHLYLLMPPYNPKRAAQVTASWTVTKAMEGLFAVSNGLGGRFPGVPRAMQRIGGGVFSTLTVNRLLASRDGLDLLCSGFSPERASDTLRTSNEMMSDFRKWGRLYEQLLRGLDPSRVTVVVAEHDRLADAVAAGPVPVITVPGPHCPLDPSEKLLELVRFGRRAAH